MDMPDPIFVINTKGIIQLVNQASLTKLGYKKEELLGSNISKLIPEKYNLNHNQYLEKYLTTKIKNIIGIGREIQCLKSNGDLYTNHLSVFEQKTDKYHVFIGILRDVGDLIKLKEEILEQNNFFQDYFEKSNIGLNLSDLKGNWLDNNPAFLKILGYSGDEAKNLSYWNVTSPEDNIRGEEQLKILLEKGQYGPYEVNFKKKSGNKVPVRLNGFLVQRNNQSYIWSSIEDISQEKKQQEDILRAMKLASVGELAAGLAHELNNPLAIILGATEVIQLKMENHDSYELIKNQVEKIKKAIGRSTKIINGMKTFATIEDNQTSKIEISSIIDEACLLLFGTFEENKIVTLIEKIPDKIFILGNKTKFQQCLLNILQNSIYALKYKSYPQIIITISQKFDKCTITIKDNGCGIPNSDLSKIFDPFFTTKKNELGTGLGLSIAYNTIKEMKGDIIISSELNAGTILTITIPTV